MLQLRVIDILNEQGHTKYWLQQRMGGMSYQNLNKLVMNKTRSIHYDTLERLSKALDCSLDDLFKIAPDPISDGIERLEIPGSD